MSERLKSKFYPEKSIKAKKYYRRIFRLVLFAVLINIIVVILYFHSLYKGEINELWHKVDKIIFKRELRIENLAKKDSISLKQIPLMFTGHSYKIDSIESMMDRKIHSFYFSQSESSIIKNGIINMNKSHYGIDVSQWQNNIDWIQVHNDTVPEKLTFFIIKATQGKSDIDPYYNYNWDNAKKENTLVGAYHFYIYEDDPKSQAENFIKTVRLKKGDILPIVDIELDCTGCTKPEIPKDELIQNLKIYLKTIENHFRVKPIIYTYTFFYNEYLDGYFNEYIFWMSHFSTTPPDGLSFQETKEQSITPTIGLWQFTNNERIKGIVGPVDMSYIPIYYMDSLLLR